MSILTPGPTYFSPPRKIPWRHRHFPSLFFYLRLIVIYLTSWARARSGTYSDLAWRKASAAVVGALESVGVRLEIEGLEVLAGVKGPCVIVANHMSTLETFVLPCLVPLEKPVTFVVKDTLLRYPVFGPIIGSRNPVAVTRKDAREDLRRVLEGGAERLGRGISLIIFPQTTRMADFDPSRFNSIGAKLAGRAGAAIVPVALATDAWGVGYPLKDFGLIRPERTVRIRFGEPIPAGTDARASQTRAVAFLSETLGSWGVKTTPPPR